MLSFARATDPLRTMIINCITAGVATGLTHNARRNRDLAPAPWPVDQEAPYIEVICPVRNEESNIVPLLLTLLAQRYPPGRWGVTVIDDGSTDQSYSVAAGLIFGNSNLRVIRAPELPRDWTGKNHALWTGYMNAPESADYLLFVDADTRHHPYTLSTVVAEALRREASLLSLVIDVEMRSFWERLLVPQVGELYTLLVGTMDQVNSGGTAAANGQFMLMSRAAYAATGSLPEVRADVAEDRAIAAACQRLKSRVVLLYGRRLVRARVYSGLGEIWSGYSKTLFWASGHNTTRALLVAAALALYALLPPLAGLRALKDSGGRQKVLRHAAMQLGPMLALRAYVCRSMGVPSLYAVAYPLAVLMGDAMLLHSLYRVVSGKGVQWKGRTYRR